MEIGLLNFELVPIPTAFPEIAVTPAIVVTNPEVEICRMMKLPESATNIMPFEVTVTPQGLLNVA